MNNFSTRPSLSSRPRELPLLVLHGAFLIVKGGTNHTQTTPGHSESGVWGTSANHLPHPHTLEIGFMLAPSFPW